MLHKIYSAVAGRPPHKTVANHPPPPQNLNKNNNLQPSRLRLALSRLGLGLGLALTLTALSLLPGTVSPAAADPTGITVTTSPTSLKEDNTAHTITATVTLTGGTYSADKTLTLQIYASPWFLRPATEGTDFTHTLTSPNNTVTIPANATSATMTFTVTAIVDNVAENTQGETFYVNATITSPAPTGQQFVIHDSVPYALSIDTSLLNEADGSTDITVTATKTSGTAPSTATTVTLALGGTAVKDTDYTATIPTLTITANANSATATLKIDPTTDTTLNECEETIVVSGTTDASSSVIISGTPTILLNDGQTPCFAGSPLLTLMCSTPANPLPKRWTCRPPPPRA